MKDELLLSPLNIAKVTDGVWENFDENLDIKEFHHTFHYLKEDDAFVVISDNWPNSGAYKVNEHKIQKAIAKEISAIIVAKDVDIKTTLPVLRVENSYIAIKKLAKHVSKTTKAKKVLITGSYGKTGFKLHLNNIVKNQESVYLRENSANFTASNYCNLASIKKGTELFLLEIPVATKDKMKRRTSLIAPDICVLTSIGHEGIERFETIDTIVENKLLIASALNKGDKLLVPYDDRYYEKIKKEIDKNYSEIDVLTFGSSKACNAYLIDKEFSDFGWEIIAKIEDVIVAYKVPFFEEYAINSSLSELLTVYHLGLDIFKAADEYSTCQNFKSSGLFYKANYKNKNFFLYDQTDRGGIEGYESFFKTFSYIKPINNGKKILVTSEFVDYKDGEMDNIDIPLFQNLIQDSGFKTIFSVEKFSEHINVLSDKNIWKNHSIDYENIKDEVLDTIEDNDIVAVKSIFKSKLVDFIDDMKNLDGINIEEFKSSKSIEINGTNKCKVIQLDETYLDQLMEVQKEHYTKYDKDDYFSKKYFLRYINDNLVYGVVLNKDESQLLGSVVLKQRKEWMEIFQITVRKSFLEHGLATKLLLYSIDLLKKQDQKMIHLMVQTDNENAIKLYEEIGFKVNKIKKAYFASAKDALRMEYEFE
ncbi:GNAT family N-acetyltransferase [Sulfurimonas sp.]